MMENYTKETLDVIVIPLEHAGEADSLEQRILESDSERYL